MLNTFPTLEALALAVAADRVNGGYVKQAEYGDDYKTVTRKANKYMVMDHIKGNELLTVTDVDRKSADTLLTHFRGYMMLQLAGKLNEFQQTVFGVIAKDEISIKNQYECSIVSCLPKVYRTDLQRKELDAKKRSSTPIQEDNFRGEIIIEACRYSTYYDKFRITARAENKILDFWYRESLEQATGMPYMIKGKVKARRGDGTTQLNYVKITG